MRNSKLLGYTLKLHQICTKVEFEGLKLLEYLVSFDRLAAVAITTISSETFLWYWYSNSM